MYELKKPDLVTIDQSDLTNDPLWGVVGLRKAVHINKCMRL